MSASVPIGERPTVSLNDIENGRYPFNVSRGPRRETLQRIDPLLVLTFVAGLDAMAIGLGWLLSLAAFPTHPVGPGSLDALPVMVVPLTIVFGWLRKGYRRLTLIYLPSQLRAMLVALIGAWTITIVAAAVFGALAVFTALQPVAGAAVGALLLAVTRRFASLIITGSLRKMVTPRCVIIGEGPGLQLLLRYAVAEARVVGVLSNDPPVQTGVYYLRDVESVFTLIRAGVVDRVLMTDVLQNATMERFAACPIEVSLLPGALASGSERLHSPERVEPRLIDLLGHSIGGWRKVLKRIQDLVLALLLLLVFGVPMLLIAIIINLDSPGPTLFRQRRTGWNSRDFSILKFRTMYHAAADHEVQQQVRPGDPRVTRVGAVLRRTSLDELPQVFNVLAGDMSFVGPRPHAPGTRAGAKYFDQVVPEYAARYRVKPGLTGLAQIRGWRGPTETEHAVIRRVESDLEYIERWSLWLDIAIVLRTPWAVARMRNAH